MRKLLVLATSVAVAAWSAAAAAQPASPPASPDASAPPSAAAPTGAGANAAASAATLAVGTTVKDNSGAAIGQVSDLKTDTDGKQVAVIRMASGDQFSVESNKLAVQNGAASINATEAQLKSMIKKPK